MSDKTDDNRFSDDKKILVLSSVFSISHYMLHLFGDGVQTFMELPGAITNGFPGLLLSNYCTI